MATYKKQWDVQGSARKPYIVSLTMNNDFVCSCPAWTRSTPRKDCKHIKKIKDENAFDISVLIGKIGPDPQAGIRDDSNDGWMAYIKKVRKNAEWLLES